MKFKEERLSHSRYDTPLKLDADEDSECDDRDNEVNQQQQQASYSEELTDEEEDMETEDSESSTSNSTELSSDYSVKVDETINEEGEVVVAKTTNFANTTRNIEKTNNVTL
jgi:hypothetical protein